MLALPAICLLPAVAGAALYLNHPRGTALRSLSQHLALYGQAPQLLGLPGQLCFAGFPWIQSRTRRTHAA